MFSFNVPTPSGGLVFDVQSGTSVFFVGANGSGKTRLAVRIEQSAGDQSHRISGHRSLELDPQIAKISEESATLGLRFGVASVGAHLAHRENSRWGSKGAIKLLNDYSFLIQLLFAEQSNTSLVSHKNSRANNGIPALPTKFEKLAEIFDKILPHRKLHVTGDDIKVQANNISQEYSASDMSDGERSVFYLIGQTLVAQPNSLLIFDEPELHIHRSILSRLWDELEAARPYCAFIVISHDLEFVASRNGKKYFLREFLPLTGWTIEEVPQETGFPEDIVTLILGSRKPILFVEGTNSSLDMAIYRACYPEWTIVPRGSHDQVIRAVNTMRANSALTRVTCAGIIDADDISSDEVVLLNAKSIFVLPVSEIENLFLQVNVIEAILANENHVQPKLNEEKENILDELFVHAADPKNQKDSVIRYCQRRIDRALKTIDLSSSADVAALDVDFQTKIAELKVSEFANIATSAISNAIKNRDPASLLRNYDNKGLMAIACKSKKTSLAQFEQWIARTLLNNSAPLVSAAVKSHLPHIAPQ